MAEKTAETKVRPLIGYLEFGYAAIEQVNSEMEMLDMRGKAYAMVPERITAFRKLLPGGFITTEIIANDGTTILMKAKVGYYREDGSEVILGTGFAQEVRGRGMVNGTSHVENCETSAVGRALGMMGLGINGGGICSAEELANAVTAQRQMKEEEQEAAREANRKGMKSNSLPEPIGEPGAIHSRKVIGADSNGLIYEDDKPKKAEVSTVTELPW